METRPKRRKPNSSYESLHDDYFVYLSEEDEMSRADKVEEDYASQRFKGGHREPKMNWTAEEDALLTSGVQQFGSSGTAWSCIAKLFNGTRDAKRCRERWVEYIDPSISQAPFTQDEDQVLLALQAELGNRWKEISVLMASNFPTRSSTGVKSRWHQLRKCQVRYQSDDSAVADIVATLQNPNAGIVPEAAAGMLELVHATERVKDRCTANHEASETCDYEIECDNNTSRGDGASEGTKGSCSLFHHRESSVGANSSPPAAVAHQEVLQSSIAASAERERSSSGAIAANTSSVSAAQADANNGRIMNNAATIPTLSSLSSVDAQNHYQPRLANPSSYPLHYAQLYSHMYPPSQYQPAAPPWFHSPYMPSPPPYSIPPYPMPMGYHHDSLVRSRQEHWYSQQPEPPRMYFPYQGNNIYPDKRMHFSGSGDTTSTLHNLSRESKN